MKFLAVIPARSGSKGLIDKNIKLLKGRPLLEHSILQAINAGIFEDVILSTDSEKYKAIGENSGATVPFLRPSSLSGSKVPTIDVLVHLLDWFNEQKKSYDAICLLQPTSPFRPPKLITKCIERFIESDADSLISVKNVPTEYNPHWVFEKKNDGFLKISTNDEKIIARRQELPPAFIRDGCIYLSKSSVVKSGSLLGKNISYYINSDAPLINIDTPKDFEYAEKFIRENPNWKMH